jgi:hypothetical protein
MAKWEQNEDFISGLMLFIYLFIYIYIYTHTHLRENFYYVCVMFNQTSRTKLYV